MRTSQQSRNASFCYYEAMKILRQWSGDSNEPVLNILKEFGVEADKIGLVKYDLL